MYNRNKLVPWTPFYHLLSSYHKIIFIQRRDNNLPDQYNKVLQAKMTTERMKQMGTRIMKFWKSLFLQCGIVSLRGFYFQNYKVIRQWYLHEKIA